MDKYLTDQMCADLGKWLRAAGYDTVIIKEPLKDEVIFDLAQQQDRFVITRDRDFTKIDPQSTRVIYLKGLTLDQWAEELREWGVDWLAAPFSRCLLCNTPFQKIEENLWRCLSCQQTFWFGSHTENMEYQLKKWQHESILKLGLGGDVMIGRLVNDHLDSISPSYVWGDLLPFLQSYDCNLVNLETTLTESNSRVPKVFNFKASPEKIASLVAGNIHVVNLANNHILDFNVEGLLETVTVLDQAEILHFGAGQNITEARKGCVVEKKGIKLGFLGCTDNEPSWKATSKKPGTFFVEVGDLDSLTPEINKLRSEVDFLILSMHWGPNMRQRPLPHFQDFAHALIDAGVDIFHGHSAHIFQGVEIYKNRIILYDTGDLVDDYAVDPLLRNDHSFYFVLALDKRGLRSLAMIPTAISHFQVNISREEEHMQRMVMLCREFGTLAKLENHALYIEINKG